MGTKEKVAFHGELIIVERSIPLDNFKEIEAVEDFKLADSETTGNHHLLKVVPGVHIFQDLADAERYFVRANAETQIYCKIEARHSAFTLKPGCEYEIFPAQEEDHITRSARRVLD